MGPKGGGDLQTLAVQTRIPVQSLQEGPAESTPQLGLHETLPRIPLQGSRVIRDTGGRRPLHLGSVVPAEAQADPQSELLLPWGLLCVGLGSRCSLWDRGGDASVSKSGTEKDVPLATQQDHSL